MKESANVTGTLIGAAGASGTGIGTAVTGTGTASMTATNDAANGTTTKLRKSAESASEETTFQKSYLQCHQASRVRVAQSGETATESESAGMMTAVAVRMTTVGEMTGIRTAVDPRHLHLHHPHLRQSSE
jgi:hypothetical protein